MKESAIEEMYETFLEEENRHTPAAEKKGRDYSDYIEKVAGHQHDLANRLLDKGMDLALEFEHSGFYAGVRYALAYK